MADAATRTNHRDSEPNDEAESGETPIQRFYAGQSVFITGGTGFLGKILIEKLLRSCPGVRTVYLLIRSKKGKSPESRLNEMFQGPLYDRLRNKVPTFRDRIVPLIGDFNVDDLGLSQSDQNLLIRDVSIIFHVAATVRFNEGIKISTIINVSATGSILNISKRMPRLKSFIHVSTIYANCHDKHIKEKFYSYPIDHKCLITLARTFSDDVIDKAMDKIISQWPNTYTCTKAIAETLIRDEGGDLPIGIFRPSIVLSTAREPIAGWVDNLYGPIGLTIAGLLGLTNIIRCDTTIRVSLVPVDNTVNALIASAWDVSNHPSKRGDDMLIYNFATPLDKSLTAGEYMNKLFILSKIYPLSTSIWRPFIMVFRRKIPYTVAFWLVHFLPALAMDAVSMCIGLRPRMWKLCKNIQKSSEALLYFCTNEWRFAIDNVPAMWDRMSQEDQLLFEFNMLQFDWSSYLVNYIKGIRTYLLDENSKNRNNSAGINCISHYWIHQIFKIVIMIGTLWIVWEILAKLFL